MRSILILGLFTASLASAAWDGYEEVRELNLDYSGIDVLSIDAGAGSLDVVGVPGSTEIMVTATIQVPDKNEEKARKKIESDMVLTLEKESDIVVLKASFDGGRWSWGDSPSIHLEVRMPDGLHLRVDDGSGSLEVSNVRGDISLDDGSGGITLDEVGGSVRIDDGSGAISITGAGGDVTINDGSGGIKVRGVAGSVTVDDGSGSIDVSNVEEDFIVTDDGSGGINFSNIAGRVETET